MKKILGLIASPRKLGNCEILVKETIKNIPQEINFSLIRLTELNILPCKGCYACLFVEWGCKIKDNMHFLMKEIQKADAIILAIPCYVLGPVGIIKMIQDRLIEIEKIKENFGGKKCILINTYGKEGWQGYTKEASILLCHQFGFNLVEVIEVLAASPGEVLLNKSSLKKIKTAAKNLFNENYNFSAKENECEFCAGTMFKLNNNFLQCCFCNAKYKINLQNEKIKLINTEENLKYKKESRKEHFEWLLFKKDEYKKLKDKLQKLKEKYKNFGEFKKPQEESKWTLI